MSTSEFALRVASRILTARAAASTAILAMLLGGTGCQQLGPATISDARFDYAEAIGTSTAESTLANLVKLRYGEMPIFLEVNQIVAGYSQEHFASGGLDLLTPFNAGKNQASLDYTVRFTERPTITYSLMSGEKFVNGYLNPMKPDVVFALADSGWPIDRLLWIAAHSINGARNYRVSTSERAQADPEFVELLTVLRDLQLRNAFNVRVSVREKRSAVEIHFNLAALDPESRQRYDHAMRGIGLDPGVGDYEISRALEATRPSSFAVHTRSLLQVMSVLSSGVDVPESQVRQGVVTAITDREENRAGESEGFDRMRFHVRTGLVAPLDAFVAVRHQGQAFWIDNDDYPTKLTFAFLSLLLTLTQTSDGAVPQLTITAN